MLQPVIHVIALDGRNPALRSRSLRRALSYAVDRKGLLEDHLLKHPATDKDTVADGVVPQGKLCRRPGRQAARVASLAGEDAGRGGPQGAGRAADQR